jgi:TolB protein
MTMYRHSPRHRIALRSISSAALLTVAATAGCGDGGTGPSAGPGALSLVIWNGDRQLGLPGIPLSKRVEAQIVDANGKPARISGRSVTWTASIGGGVVQEASQVTDSKGIASAGWILGQEVGQNLLTLAVEDAGSVTFQSTAKYGGPIAFASSRLGGATSDWDIFLMEDDGSDPIALTPGSAFDYYPTWSPDGSEVAFVRAASGLSDSKDIFSINADGSGLRQLTFDGTSDRPAWSPDGSRIAFARGVPGDIDIFTMAANGSDVMRVTHTDNEVEIDPDWSPDGLRIVYAKSTPSFDDVDIYVINADGTNPRRLVWEQGVPNLLPKWSPDGTLIMYQAYLVGTPGGPEVMLINSDGTGKRFLTTGLPGDWSPDGQHVLVFDFGVGDAEMWDIFKVNIETGERVNLTSHSALDNWPAWRPAPTP